MGVTKKKRGQQRKAIKNPTAAVLSGGSNINTSIITKVQNGNNKATLRLVTAGIDGISFEQSGILSVVLGFLNRCEHETFDGVMDSIGGNLSTPATWIKLLSKAILLDGSCRLQIAYSIGPLVRCMCNDTERIFFKSNKHWRDGIVSFVQLVSKMLRLVLLKKNNDFEEMKSMDALLNHEGLLTSTIQWGYWGKHRPDIVKLLGAKDCAEIVSLGREITTLLIRDASERRDSNRSVTAYGKRRLSVIGSTPIVNKEYDPNCNTSYVEGLARQLQLGRWTPNSFQPLVDLVEEAGCVDKGVIKETISLGMANINVNYSIANQISRTSVSLLLKKSMDPCDTRVAFAIRNGLIEMCLGFMETFYESLRAINDDIKQTFVNIHEVSLHQKTAKAIRSKRRSIEKELARLDQNTNITSNPKCTKLLDMIRSILYLNGTYCCRCSKSLSKTDVKLCNGCNSMVYCSRACQKEDWLNGHKLICCTSYTDETAGRFQGRVLPASMPKNERDAKKLKDLEVNSTMLHLKLFLDHSDTILRQAEALELPLYNCVVQFYLRNKSPPAFDAPTVEVESYTDLFDTPEAREDFEETRSKENIICVYHSIVHVRCSTEELAMQSIFPHEWLTKQSK